MSVSEVFEAFFYALPQSKYGDDVLIWMDGSEILCKTEWLAETLADVIENLSGGTFDSVRTGYYDPEEDMRSGEVDRYTGWYYIDFD